MLAISSARRLLFGEGTVGISPASCVCSAQRVSDTLGAWILDAQAQGDINPGLPPEVVLFTIFARGCDPVPAFLKGSGNFTDEQIVEWVMRICLRGLRAGA